MPRRMRCKEKTGVVVLHAIQLLLELTINENLVRVTSFVSMMWCVVVVD
jgi:hypothetical protein